MESFEVDLDIPLEDYISPFYIVRYTDEYSKCPESLTILGEVNSVLNQTEYFTNNIADLMFPGLLAYQPDKAVRNVYEFYFFKANRIAVDAEVHALYIKVWIDFDDDNKIKFHTVRCKKITEAHRRTPSLYNHNQKKFYENINAIVNKTGFLNYYSLNFQVLEIRNDNDVYETYFILDVSDGMNPWGYDVLKVKLNIN